MQHPPPPLLDQVIDTAVAWHRGRRGAALATVVSTWGSAPRPVGSQMAVSGLGEMAGSVSGGCVEGAVVVEALAALQSRVPRLVRYGVSDDSAFAAGLACGGSIEVLIEPVGAGQDALPEGTLVALISAKAAGQAVALVTDLGTWQRQLLRASDDPMVAARLAQDLSGREADDRFVAVHNLPLRLIVIGAVHIAQVLLPMAGLCGYAVTLIDPRTSFAAAARFPQMTVVDGWPDAAVAAVAPDARTAIVTLTHDPKLDDPALLAALGSPAFYIGCLGSKRSHAQRLERLRNAGVGERDLARLHGPVGLPIGAQSPAEIAISILAQLTQVLRRGA